MRRVVPPLRLVHVAAPVTVSDSSGDIGEVGRTCWEEGGGAGGTGAEGGGEVAGTDGFEAGCGEDPAGVAEAVEAVGGGGEGGGGGGGWGGGREGGGGGGGGGGRATSVEDQVERGVERRNERPETVEVETVRYERRVNRSVVPVPWRCGEPGDPSLLSAGA